MARNRRGRKLPSEEEIRDTLFNLKAHGEEMTALMGAAYVDQMLEEVLRVRLRPLSQADDEAMFDVGKGLLGPFMAKVRMAHALGIVDPRTFAGLKVIARIRNRFAHPLSPVSFRTSEIEADCLKLAHVPWYVMAHMVARPGGIGALRFGQSGPIEAEVSAIDIYAGTCVAIYTGLLGARILAMGEGAKIAERDAPPPSVPPEG